MLYKLMVLVGKDTKTYFTISSDTEEAIGKIRAYLNENSIEGKIQSCSAKPAITFIP